MDLGNEFHRVNAELQKLLVKRTRAVEEYVEASRYLSDSKAQLAEAEFDRDLAKYEGISELLAEDPKLAEWKAQAQVAEKIAKLEQAVQGRQGIVEDAKQTFEEGRQNLRHVDDEIAEAREYRAQLTDLLVSGAYEETSKPSQPAALLGAPERWMAFSQLAKTEGVPGVADSVELVNLAKVGRYFDKFAGEFGAVGHLEQLRDAIVGVPLIEVGGPVHWALVNTVPVPRENLHVLANQLHNLAKQLAEGKRTMEETVQHLADWSTDLAIQTDMYDPMAGVFNGHADNEPTPFDPTDSELYEDAGGDDDYAPGLARDEDGNLILSGH